MKSSLVDLQVNGLLGVDFSNPETVHDESLLKATDALEGHGTGAFLATVVTSSIDRYRKTLPALARFIDGTANRGRMLGIHLEGPFISPEEGAVGVHPRAFVQTPSLEAFEELRDLCKGHLKLITVAPERPGACALIRHAVSRGTTVSVGHSLGSYEDLLAARDAGATLCTHLGNGIPNMLHRHKNPVVAGLASPLTAMLIADGHHLPKEFLIMALKAKGTEDVCIVSDMAPPAGLPEGVYEFFGTRAKVCADGAIRNLNAPTLAGSSACLKDCMDFLAANLQLDGKTLWLLGRDNPLRAIGLSPSDLHLPELVEF